MRRAHWAILGALMGAVVCTVSAAAQAEGFAVDSVAGVSYAARDVAVVEGRVLAATQGGLWVREPNGEARVLDAADGLPGRLVSVSVTPRGIWVGGVEACVLLDRDLRVRRTLPLPRVSRVVRFGGHDYAATHGGGLLRLGVDGRPSRHIRLGRSHARERQTDALVVGDELWVGTAGAGVLRMGPDERLRARITRARGLLDDLVWGLSAAGDDVLVATASGADVVRRRRVRTGSALRRASAGLPIPDVRAVLRSGGSFWLATFGGGLHEVREGRVRAVDMGSAAPGRVHGLARAGEAVYVAADAGVGRVRGAEVHWLRRAGLGSADLTCLARAFGRVWLGTFGHGLARLEGRRVVPVREATERWGMDPRINDLAVRGRGRAQELYIATDRGLYRHDGRSFVPVLEPGAPPQVHITSLFVDPRSGELWVTGTGYLGRYTGTAWESWTGDGLPDGHLHAVTRDRQGRVWVGGLRGLFERQEDGTFVRHDVSTGALAVNWVTALVPWGGGVVAGTYHGGLSWASEGRFHIEGAGALPARWVNPHAMAERGGLLWVGTQARGLLIGRRGAWTLLTRADGLPSDDVTDILVDGEGAWIATRGGLAHVVRFGGD